MSFESGNISLRVFHVAQKLPVDALERFQQRGIASLAVAGIEPVTGWIGGRHLMDAPLTEENSRYGGYLRLQLLTISRKVPAAQLKAECALEEQAHMRAENKSFVDRKTRAEIRKNVMARLLPTMPPTLKGIKCVYDERENVIYTDATSESQSDLFRMHFRNATGIDPVPLTPHTAGILLAHDTHAWGKTSFAPAVGVDEIEEEPGLDFLTWLLYRAECNPTFPLNDALGRFSIAIDGPLLLTATGAGAFETALRKGVPTTSVEANAALLAGKKLERAKLIIGRAGDDNWSCAFDARNFVFRSLKLPELKEVLDAASTFQDRILKLDTFRACFMELYRQFAALRSAPYVWAAELARIRAWLADRTNARDEEKEECDHDEHDHGICLACGEDITDTLVGEAEAAYEGDR